MSRDNIDQAIEYFKAKLDIIDDRLKSIETKQDYFSHRFIVIDAKKSVSDYIVRNWWRFAAVIIPMLFFLGEIGLYIRRLI